MYVFLSFLSSDIKLNIFHGPQFRRLVETFKANLTFHQSTTFSNKKTNNKLHNGADRNSPKNWGRRMGENCNNRQNRT